MGNRPKALFLNLDESNLFFIPNREVLWNKRNQKNSKRLSFRVLLGGNRRCLHKYLLEKKEKFNF